MATDLHELRTRTEKAFAELREASTDGHNCVVGESLYNEVVHLLADWPAYSELFEVLLEGSQVSGKTVLGLL